MGLETAFWVFFSILFIATGWGFLAAYQATHVPRYRLGLTPQDLHLPFESRTLLTEDSVRLAAWFLVPQRPKGVVIVQHGYGTCRADPLQLIALVFRGGYAVVSFDFRGHGESGGSIGFGRWEARDVRAAIDAAAADPRLKNLPVGYLGISMGGAIGIRSAVQDERIRAIVSDSSFARLGPTVARYQRVAYYLPEIPFGWVTRACLAVALRAMPGALDPVRAVGKISPRPILIIHGDEDLSIPVGDARLLYAAAREPKRLWIVPGAGHVASVCHGETEYAQTVLQFLGEHLKPS